MDSKELQVFAMILCDDFDILIIFAIAALSFYRKSSIKPLGEGFGGLFHFGGGGAEKTQSLLERGLIHKIK